jgi:hypothetical protein
MPNAARHLRGVGQWLAHGGRGHAEPRKRRDQPVALARGLSF